MAPGPSLAAPTPPLLLAFSTALLGATMMFEILCPLAEAVAARRYGG